MNFLFKNPNELLIESFKLGRKLYTGSIRPNHAISLWRGGTIVGLGINEFYRMQGIFINHTAITTSAYCDDLTQREVIIKGLEHVIKVIVPEDILLIIDDIFDTGDTIKTLLALLKNKARSNTPGQIKIATIDRKPEKNKFLPDLTYLNDMPKDLWVNYPHEISDLLIDDSTDIIRDNRNDVFSTISQNHFDSISIKTNASYRWITPEEILINSIKLGVTIYYSNFEPDFLIALWPGGVLSGIYVHETYKYLNKLHGNKKRNPDHVAINTAATHLSYKSTIIGLPYLFENINSDSKILIIDTSYKGGIHVNSVIDKLKYSLRRNLNHKNIKIATVYFDSKTQYTWINKPYYNSPHYFYAEIDSDVIYPHSIHKLSNPKKEVFARSQELYDIIWGNFSCLNGGENLP